MRNFMGDKFFLSNFYQLPNPIKDPIDNDILYWTAEHAFQAMKTNDIGERKKIAQATSPAKARWLGRSIYLRNDWEEIKVNTMRWIVKSKFQMKGEHNAYP